jgi:octaheme c-type cytochrome (tetrathionate reductase family)
MKHTKILMAALVFVAGAALAAEDHAKNMEGTFASPTEVTKKCLECHPEAAKIMRTTHWTWSSKQNLPGKGEVDRGKKDIINNYCISLAGNWPRCTSCHIGYGWKDGSFDLSDSSRIDCLVCHDTTGKYKKNPAGAGMPVEGTDLAAIAQKVGKPSRANCGACHFFGGGGDAVKHGDLDSTQTNPTRENDVHLSKMLCQDCHTAKDHDIRGNAMVVSPADMEHIGCAGACHKEAPHKEATLNKHAERVACQTCHIPEFARAASTKTNWDWSTAGQDRPDEKDADGRPLYDKKKGTFTWAKNIVPTYAWYNGTGSVYLAGEKINPSEVTKLSSPVGDKADPKSKIAPFKYFTGKQPYDKKNDYFVTPKLFGKEAPAYWAAYDWNKAIEAGMKASGLAYSGEYGFAETAMYWPINHMVAPKEKALKCDDCHGEKGRMDWAALGYGKDPAGK